MENMHNLIALLQNKQLKYDDLMLGFDLILYCGDHLEEAEALHRRKQILSAP